VGCLVLLLALISPRLALIFTWLLTDILSGAFDSWLLPFIGFFLLPWTTLAYAWMWDYGPGRTVEGFEWFLVILAFVFDLGSLGGGSRARKKRD
jgi:hypothetical protein